MEYDEISNCFFKNHWKSKFKISKIKKWTAKKLKKKTKKLNGKTKKKVSYKSNLKKWFKTNNFPHLIANTRFHIRYFSEDEKCPTLLPAIFSNTKKPVAGKFYQNWHVMNYFVYIPKVKKICRKDFGREKHWMEGC